MKHRLLVPLVAALLAGCSSVELTSIADTEYLMTSRRGVLEKILVVYDGKDLTTKASWEDAVSSYIAQNTTTRAVKDIDLFSPMRVYTQKERVTIFREEHIDGILLLEGGGSGRTPADWTLPTAQQAALQSPAWKQGQMRLVLPADGRIAWFAAVPNLTGGILGPEQLTRSFVAAIGGELLRFNFVELRQDERPGMKGFNN
jgi:hypothetical protein